MTTASAAVRKAVARAGVSTLAIAERTTEDLLAAMTDEQRAEMTAKLGAAPAPVAPPPAAAAGDMPDDGDEDDGTKPCPTCKEQMKDGKCAKCAPDSNADAGAGAEARDPRVAAVAAAVANDDACKGKADLALAMLADPDFNGLSAAAMVKLLGRTPAAGSSDSNEGGAAMMAAMRQAANLNLGNDGNPAPVVAANNGWDDVWADVNARHARK